MTRKKKLGFTSSSNKVVRTVCLNNDFQNRTIITISANRLQMQIQYSTSTTARRRAKYR